MEITAYTPIWYPADEVQATFDDLINLYKPILHRAYLGQLNINSGLLVLLLSNLQKNTPKQISRQLSIDRYNMILLAKEILLSLDENHILAYELLDWMHQVGEERRKEILTAI